MAYITEELYNESIKAIDDNGLFWVDDIIAYLPCSKPTFYEHFPSESDELNELKERLYKNRISLKVKLRKKWEDSDNATLQMGLMKLIAEDDERKKLSQTYQDHTTNGKEITPDSIDYSKLSKAALEEISKLADEAEPE